MVASIIAAAALLDGDASIGYPAFMMKIIILVVGRRVGKAV